MNCGISARYMIAAFLINKLVTKPIRNNFTDESRFNS